MTNPMPIPDLRYSTLPVPADADMRAIVTTLATVTGCEPQANALGNMQSVHRIDPDGKGGYLLTYPAAASTTAVQAVVTSATP